MNDALGSAPHRAAWPETPTGPAGVSRRPYSLMTLPSMIATWRERIRVRKALAQMSKANPHMIDDIGLTRRQAEAEIAKPFWQD